MPYSLPRNRNPASELIRIAYEQVESALTASAQLPADQATHQIRKYCKKIRALLRLVRTAPGNCAQLYRFENSRYRGIAEVLSGSRDTVSLYDALTKQLGGNNFPEIASLLQSRIDISDAHIVLNQARQSLQEGKRHIERWDFSPLTKGDLKRGYAHSYQRAHKAMRNALITEDNTRFHTLRKRVKDQWYHTRLLQPLYPRKIGRRRDDLKHLSSALGDWRDLRLLCTFLAENKSALDVNQCQEVIPLLDQAQQRLQELRKEIDHLCGKLFPRKKWSFD